MKRNTYKILVKNTLRKRQLTRPARRWENNIKIDFKKISDEGEDWLFLVQDMNKLRKGSYEVHPTEKLTFSRRPLYHI
jgi:hypothetical protein